MDLSILNAVALGAEAPAPAGGGASFFIVIIVMFVLMYFMMIRPQQKRQKQHKAMIEALGKGDEVIINGGIAGRIDALGDSFVTVEVAEGVKLRVQRASIAQVLPKGTLKSA